MKRKNLKYILLVVGFVISSQILHGQDSWSFTFRCGKGSPETYYFLTESECLDWEKQHRPACHDIFGGCIDVCPVISPCHRVSSPMGTSQQNQVGNISDVNFFNGHGKENVHYANNFIGME